MIISLQFKIGYPIVFFGRDVPIDDSKILSNDFEGGYNAKKHLSNLAKQIWFISRFLKA